MANAAKSPYSSIVEQQLAPYKANLQSAQDGLLCVVSYAALSPEATAALEASAERLGYAGATTFITVEPAGGGTPLDGASLLHVLEAIDPLGLVATDALTCELLSQGYHRPLTFNEVNALLGRPCACFSSFSALIASEDTKAQAWQLLKTLAARM